MVAIAAIIIIIDVVSQILIMLRHFAAIYCCVIQSIYFQIDKMGKITIHGLKKRTRVQDWQLNKECMDVHLEEISKDIKYYSAFATKMRLNTSDISEIDATRSPYSEKTALVLKKWKSTTFGTYRDFVAICLDIEVGDVAKKMCELCASKQHALCDGACGLQIA